MPSPVKRFPSLHQFGAVRIGLKCEKGKLKLKKGLRPFHADFDACLLFVDFVLFAEGLVVLCGDEEDQLPLADELEAVESPRIRLAGPGAPLAPFEHPFPGVFEAEGKLGVPDGLFRLPVFDDDGDGRVLRHPFLVR